MKKRQGAYREITNIPILPSGCQVVSSRNKKEYSKHFAGHSKESLKAAHRWRDRVLRLLPNKRSQPIPSRILSKLRLKQPVVGVSRYETRRFYSVTYHGKKGRTRVRTFSWRDRMEPAETTHLAEIMDALAEKGVAAVVRVIPDPHKDIGLNILSQFHYGPQIKLATFESLAEALSALMDEAV